MGKIFSKAPSELLISETSIWGPLVTCGPPPSHWSWERLYAVSRQWGEDAMVCMVQSPVFLFKLVFLVPFQTSHRHWSIFAISLFCDTRLNVVQSYLSPLSAGTV